MNPYVLLFCAVAAEIVATSSLKITDGFTKIAPTLLVLSSYALAFWLMSIITQVLPIGIVYAIWSGVGIVGITLVGISFYNEAFGIWHLIGTAFILIGTVILSLITNPSYPP